MPEYLAPGVYVEEIDTGSKPIEGVSTSTAGMLGVTERGPVNVPILITSYGEYTRWFGERLNSDDFSNGNGPHCYLPHAVEGFFTNGGKRVYVTRVLDTAGARRAEFLLHDRGQNDSARTMLLRAAGEGTGITGGTPIYVLDINTPIPNALANGSRIRIGDGSDAEYRVVGLVDGAANTTHVPLSFSLSRAHNATATAHHINRVVIAAFTLDEDAAPETEEILLAGAAADIAALAVDQLLEIGAPFSSEHRFIRSRIDVDATRVRLRLDSPLAMSHADGDNASRLNIDLGDAAVPVDDDTLAVTANAGDRMAFVVDRNNNFDDRDDLVIFNIGNNAAREARRIGDLHMLALSTGAYGNYATSALVQRVDLGDDGAVTAKILTADASAGATVIALDNRVGLANDGVIRIGAAPNDEYVTIAGIPDPSPGGAAPNAGNVELLHPLNRDHANGDEVRLQNPPTVNNTRPATVSILEIVNGDSLMAVTDGTSYAANEFIRVITASGQTSYHRLTVDATDLEARLVSLTVPLSRAHAAGATVVERASLLNIQALDAGAWGNRLRISVVDEPAGLVSRTTVRTVVDATHIRLASAAGVEAGTILEVVNPVDETVVGDPLKVVDINRASDFTITLAAPGISGPQQAPGLVIRSREFRFTVHLLRQPDPALPSRNEIVIDTEVFRHLSMDERHSRYIAKIIGDINGELRLADRRPEGESKYVRVEDLAPDQATRESIRFGPETLIDILPSGRRRPARHALELGNDSIGTITDDTYIGADDPEPLQRTGLHSLRNEEEISIIACPGRTRPGIQGALIDHCELMRYRFAVLDGPPPPNDSLNDVQVQRQQFDTKYAAIYHPWLLIPDPYPLNLSQIPNYPIPPSGHALGIYARTDIDRGVHKAPANEVVRGVLGLQRLLNKGEHDILNPYPVNINVIRDFRPNNRGIRIFGARCITSDPDWKYVNVRRLLIFIENSIDRGLQWVVFEPNAEPLWARVTRTISNFLTTVWRNGALEGTKREEAYFVKCDRTTMTQTDIDNGRLIVVIGVAPVKPAEFVIIRIGLWTAHAED